MIGPTFGRELLAGGLGDGVSWTSDGVVNFNDDVPDTVRQKVAAILAKHDASAKLPVIADTQTALLSFVATLPNCPKELQDAARAINPDVFDF